MAILPWLAVFFRYLHKDISHAVVTAESFAKWSEDRARDYKLRSASVEGIFLHWRQSLPKFDHSKAVGPRSLFSGESICCLYFLLHTSNRSACPCLLLLLVTFAVDFISQGKRGGKQIEL